MLLFPFPNTKIQQKNETTKFFCTFFNLFFWSQTAIAKSIYTSPSPPFLSGSKKKGLGNIRTVEHLILTLVMLLYLGSVTGFPLHSEAFLFLGLYSVDLRPHQSVSYILLRSRHRQISYLFPWVVENFICERSLIAGNCRMPLLEDGNQFHDSLHSLLKDFCYWIFIFSL